MNLVAEWINKLGLIPHPEGGYFKEIYRSEEMISKDFLPGRYNGNRSFGTSIYYLLESGDISMLHRIKSDEIWHFYDGSPIVLIEINPNGECEKIILSRDISKNENPQHVIKAGTWFGAYPQNINSFSLVGCTVCPGFDFQDFEIGKRETLIKEFPNLKEEILMLTK